MRRLLITLVALAALGVVVIPASPAGASQYNGTVELTCTTLTAAGTGSHVLNRDNTGEGQEALRIDVFDGTNALIFTFPFQNTLGTFGPGMINTTNYDTLPTANPIRFVLTSLAGNGLPEQVDVDVTGTCDEIPTVNCTLTEVTPGVPPAETSSQAAQKVPGVCGVIDVNKIVTGSAPADTSFSITVQCQAPPEEEQPVPRDLPDGEKAPFTKTLTFGPTGGSQQIIAESGSTCTATETPPPGCTLVSIDPASFSVFEGEITHVVVTNSCAVAIQPNFTG
jgi:hypothetical protein